MLEWGTLICDNRPFSTPMKFFRICQTFLNQSRGTLITAQELIKSRGRKNGKQKAGNWKTYNKGFAQNLHDEIINDMFGKNANKKGFQNGASQNVNIKIGANGFGKRNSKDFSQSEDQKLQEYQNKISDLNAINHQRKCTISRLQADLESERSRNQAQQIKIEYS